MLGFNCHFSCSGKQNFKSEQLLYFRIDLFFFPNLHDLFKPIRFPSSASVWQAFQGTVKVALSWGYSMVGLSFFAKEIATASGKTLRRDGGFAPHFVEFLCCASIV